MSQDYTFISDLNNQPQMPPQGYGQQMPPQGYGQQAPAPMYQPPVPNPRDLFKNYLAESDDESDDDSEEENDNPRGSNWQHYYGIATLILLAVILYYVFKIRKEISSIYEE